MIRKTIVRIWIGVEICGRKIRCIMILTITIFFYPQIPFDLFFWCKYGYLMNEILIHKKKEIDPRLLCFCIFFFRSICFLLNDMYTCICIKLIQHRRYWMVRKSWPLERKKNEIQLTVVDCPTNEVVVFQLVKGYPRERIGTKIQF